MDDVFYRNDEKESAEPNFCTTSSSNGKENLFIKFPKDYMWEAINHYLACNKQLQKAKREICNSSQSEERSRIKAKIASCQIQMSIIENLHNYFMKDQKRHIMTLMAMIPNDAFNEQILKTETDIFIQNECSKDHDDQHQALMKQLLQLWNMWDDKYDDDDANEVHLCSLATNLLQKKYQELKFIESSIENVQSMFLRRIAREDFLNHEQNITIIQKHIRSENIRSSIEHMFHKPKIMIHVGGSVLDLSIDEMLAGRSIQKLDLNAEEPRWQTLSVHLPAMTAHAGVAVCGNKVFISGGRNSFSSYLLCLEPKDIVYNSIHMLTLHDDKLQSLPPMEDSRSHHGFVTFLSTVWAIGGSNGMQSLNTVESFDPTTLRWSKRPHLLQERSGAAITVHDNKIWVLGGRNTAGDILSSVEVYDAREEAWRYSQNLPKPLMLSAAISVLGSLFVIGGLTGTKVNPIAEAKIYLWNNISGNWKFWTKMQEPRLNHSVTRYGQFISICGGHGLVKGVPTIVSGSISYHVSNGDGQIFTPMIGTRRIGVGIAMAGDHSIIKNIISKTSSSRDSRTDTKSVCLSCVSSSICNKSHDGHSLDNN